MTTSISQIEKSTKAISISSKIAVVEKEITRISSAIEAMVELDEDGIKWYPEEADEYTETLGLLYTKLDGLMATAQNPDLKAASITSG